MKRTIKRLMAALLLLSILFTGFPPVSAEAATTNSIGKRYNIMLVIDGSGSLTSPSAGYTDPKGMRYELVGELMGILEDDGHNMGAIVFSGTQSKSATPTDKDMEKGIMLNTGMMSLDKLAPDGRMPKDYLEDAIKRTGVDNSANGCTDIGTALRLAQEQLQQMQAQNGLESVVFLFTDGNTAFYGNPAGIMNKSIENRDKATLEMSQSGIRLFGAFLNDSGKLDDAEMKRLVCAANGIGTTSEQFQYSYVEITDSSTIHEATNSFLAFLGKIDWPLSDDDVYIDDIHKTFTIPGIGVEEMNIRLYSHHGDDLPNLDVKITQPDGTVITGVALKNSRTYRVYKLVNPDPGLWHIDVTVPEGNKIEFKFRPVLSLYIDSQVESNPAPQDIHVNLTPDFTCLLSQAGTVITNPAAYMGYDCVLRIKNVSNGDTTEYKVQANTSGSLVCNPTLDTYGTFEVTTVFTCGEIVVTSEPIVLDLTNRTPTSSYIPNQELTYGLFQPKTTELDLTMYFSDPEDGSNLVFALDNTSCNTDGITLSGSNLTLINKAVGTGNIAISATDTQGASIVKTVYVETTNATVWYIIGIISVLILIAVIVILYMRHQHGYPANGTLSMTFDMMHQDRACKVNLELSVPGVSASSKTTLLKLITEALRDDNAQIQPGLYARDVMSFLLPFSSELSNIKLRADIKKQGKKKVGAVRASQGKRSTLLFNSFANYFLNDTISVDIDFTAADDQTSNPFDDPFGGPVNAPKSTFFDDLDDLPQPDRKKKEKKSAKAEPKDSFSSGSDNDFDFF